MALRAASWLTIPVLAQHPGRYRCAPVVQQQPLGKLRGETGHYAPPLHITPATSDLDEARRWFRNLRPMGVEGLVVKGEATPYRPGKLDWL